MRIILILLTSFRIISSCHNIIGGRSFWGEEDAKDILKEALSRSNYNMPTANVIDTASFIHVIEPELIRIYGKENIFNEKPYEIYHFDRYWVGVGTLPKGYVGGTFEVVLDASQSKIIFIRHGK